MVDLVSVRHAILVAEHLSFSRAARVVGVQQSAVSRRVRALEDQLGVSLFERDSTGVRLTEAGRRFLERTRPALSEIDHAMKAAASAGRGAEGVIRIGILASVSGGFLRDLIGSYRGRHPAITMEIVEGSASQHLAGITERQLDVAFVMGTPAAKHCDSVVLWEARVFAALPEGHALADGEAICWESLRHEDFIVSRDAPGPEIHDYIVRRTTAFGRSPSIERHGVGGDTLMHLVGLGFGISIASEAVTATRYPDVVFRPLATADDMLPYSAVWLPGNDNPALRRFLSLARSLASGWPAPDSPKWVS